MTPDTRKDQYILSTPYELEVRSDQEIYKYTIKKDPRHIEEMIADLAFNKGIYSKELGESFYSSYIPYANNDAKKRLGLINDAHGITEEELSSQVS